MTNKQYARHSNNTFGKGIAKAVDSIRQSVMFEFEEGISEDKAEQARREKDWQTILRGLAEHYPSVQFGKKVLFVGTYQEVCDFHDDYFDPHNRDHGRKLCMVDPRPSTTTSK